jgi:hypothetical protein
VVVSAGWGVWVGVGSEGLGVCGGWWLWVGGWGMCGGCPCVEGWGYFFSTDRVCHTNTIQLE